MARQYLLGIDLGTSGVRALLMDEGGMVVCSRSCDYPLKIPRPGWAEQEPNDWWRATCRAVRELLEQAPVRPRDIAAAGLTGQMHGSVFLDGRGDVVCPAILWCDQRTGAECEEITRRVGRRRVLEVTCNPVLTGFQAPKILWLQRNSPAAWHRVAHVLLPKDYLRFRLTGEFATDVSDASGTSLFDVRKRRWSPEMMEAVGVRPSLLPEPFESPALTGSVSPQAARLTGLLAGTPVAAGAGDQAAGGIGSGIVEEGRVSLSLGTSGVVFVHASRPLRDRQGRLHTFCHAVPGAWHLMGVMLSAGGSYRWFRDAFWTAGGRRRSRSIYGEMERAASAIPPGCDGLLFLPYLSGERCPYPDPNARAVFFGLSLTHSIAHAARSILEGVAFGIRDSVELMREAKVPVGKTFRVTGGGSRSDLWVSICADVLGRKMARLAVDEGPAYGAAMIAATAIGLFPDVPAACRRLVKERRVFTPDRNRATLYARLYPVYRNLYASLRGSFADLARVTS